MTETAACGMSDIPEDYTEDDIVELLDAASLQLGIESPIWVEVSPTSNQDYIEQGFTRVWETQHERPVAVVE